MPTISVIVPVYKVEAYLDRCVQSILNQTYTDFELILVDDGSPDGCGALCDAWAEKDSRIRVIHKQNGGLSDARNAGIEIAEGKYLTFVDSDDYIHPKMLEALYEAIQKTGAKVSVCAYQETDGEALPDFDQTGYECWKTEDFYLRKCVNATVAWGKLYEAGCFETMRYPKGKIHEDEFVTYLILFDQKETPFVDLPLYGYFRNSAGITKSQWKPQRLHALEAMVDQCAFFRKKGLWEIFAKRARDYILITEIHIETIDARSDAQQFAEQRVWLLKNGRRILRSCRGKRIFDLEMDGWLLVRFFPRKMRVYNLMKVAQGRLFGKKK